MTLLERLLSVDSVPISDASGVNAPDGTASVSDTPSGHAPSSDSICTLA